MNIPSAGWIIAAAAAAAVFVVDLLTPVGYVEPMLYVLPILLSWMMPRRHTIMLVTGSLLLLTWIGVALSPGELTLEALTNRVMASALLLTIGWLLLINKQSIEKVRVTQQVVEESESRLRMAQRAAKIGTFDWDIAGGTVVWQPETECIWGLKEGEFTGTYEHWRKLVHPEDLPKAEAIVRKALADRNAPCEFEHRTIRPDGMVSWMFVKAATVWKAGKPIRMVGLNMDITERKENEEMLRQLNETLEMRVMERTEVFRESEGRLRTFIEYAPAAIAMFDRDMRYVASSRRWIDDYGLTAPIIGQSHYEVFPELPDHWKEVHRRGLAGETLRAEEERFVRSNGVSQWVKWEVLPWYSGTEVGGILIVAEDVTERVCAREALSQSEERFRGLFEHAAEGIAIVDFEGWFQRCNQAYCAMVGYTAEELSTMKFSALIYPEDLSHNVKLVRQLTDGEIPFFEVTNRYIRKSGQSAWVSKRVSILRNDKGEPTHMLAIVTDVTDRKQAEETLKRNQADLLTYQEQLQDLTAKLIVTQEQEQQRIARELHDDVSQRLAGIVLDVSMLEQQSPPGREARGAALESIRTQLEQLADDVHSLAYRLHPSLLTHAGLRPAIQDHL